ncbi:MAG: serine hydrolase [Clostridia bacterium]
MIQKPWCGVSLQPLCFEPGTRWQYSLCHDVLAGLVCVLTGKPFRVYVQDNVFDPLDMKGTYYHRTPEVESRMASQYTFVEEGGELADAVEAQRAGGTNNGYFKRWISPSGILFQAANMTAAAQGLLRQFPITPSCLRRWQTVDWG